MYSLICFGLFYKVSSKCLQFSKWGYYSIASTKYLIASLSNSCKDKVNALFSWYFSIYGARATALSKYSDAFSKSVWT